MSSVRKFFITMFKVYPAMVAILIVASAYGAGGENGSANSTVPNDSEGIVDVKGGGDCDKPVQCLPLVHRRSN